MGLKLLQLLSDKFPFSFCLVLICHLSENIKKGFLEQNINGCAQSYFLLQSRLFDPFFT